jgi:hypothetical protein
MGLKGGEKRSRASSNALRHERAADFNGLRRKSKINKKSLNRGKVSNNMLKHIVSKELSIINRNSGSIGKGFVSWISKASYIEAPTIAAMIMTTAKAIMRFRSIAMSIHTQI